MFFRQTSHKALRILASLFVLTTVLLALSLGTGWWYAMRLLKASTPSPPPLEALVVPAAPASPLQIHYQLDVPGRGEIFPALAGGSAADYWPVAILAITNGDDHPMVQTISAEIPGWSTRAEQTVVVAARTTQRLTISPELLPRAYDNQEMRRANLEVGVRDPAGGSEFSQRRPVYLHSASDLFWGKRFSNAQFIARWVTPHDAAVLRLVSEARKYAINGRLPGYNQPQSRGNRLPMQVRAQARDVFDALKHTGISYVSSIFTFGDFTGEAQRIRLPEETLTLSTANCIDVSVAFASAIENLGMNPVIVIVPGHAFAGVRLGPESQEKLYLDLTVLPKGTFEQAVARADSWLKKTPPDQVLMIDIAAARALRIYPIPLPEKSASVAERIPVTPPLSRR